VKKIHYLALSLLTTTLLSAQEEAAGRVAGELAVSASGAAVYTVPFALPPGIGQAVPTLALTYNSQGGDGIAGWGWNLSGLSTISRVGATLHHDGIIDPVDFDELDRFALDGQRLLLKNNGTYGADGTEYQTENYSNIKITAHGQRSVNGGNAPSFFTVYYPDGSRAWYGQSNSFGQLEWAISRWEDPQGNRIDYSYTSDGGVLQIDTISYGGQSKTTHLNTIEFEYEEKKQRSVNYINGLIFYRNSILKKIKISLDKALYRSFELTHQSNSSGYEKVTQVVEKNADEQRKPALEFDYNQVKDTDVVHHSENIGSFFFKNSQKASFSFDSEKHQLIPGDFNGDGYQDMIIKDMNHFRVVLSSPDGIKSLSESTEIKLPSGTYLHSFVAGNFQDQENRVLSRQGIVSISQTLIPKENPNSYLGASQEYSQTEFTTYALNPSNDSFQSYSKVWENLNYNNEYDACGKGKVDLISKSYYPADFTGDGLNDILMIENPYTTKNCSFSNLNSCQCSGRVREYRRLFLVDMDRQKQNDFVKLLGGLTLKSSDDVQLADFDGDGIPDLWHFYLGGLTVYNLYGGKLQKLTTFADAKLFSLDKPTLIGDFNGDGKADLMIPFKSGFDNWNLLTSTGKEFKWDFLTGTSVDYKVSDNNKFTSHYLARDVDGDGVSDLITQYQEKDEMKLRVFQNIATAQGWRRAFKEVHYSRFENLKGKGTPLEFKVHKTDFNPIYVYLDDATIYQKVIPLNHRQEVLLNGIKHKGLEKRIEYEALGAGNSYTKEENQSYPLVCINNVPTLPLVSKITSQAGDLQTTQLFHYYGAVSHARGLGFLGFMGVARTNAYGVNTPSLWSVSRHDPKLRGAMTHSWQPLQNPFFSPLTAFDIPQHGFAQNPLPNTTHKPKPTKSLWLLWTTLSWKMPSTVLLPIPAIATIPTLTPPKFSPKEKAEKRCKNLTTATKPRLPTPATTSAG
jgi:hypothetical protein